MKRFFNILIVCLVLSTIVFSATSAFARTVVLNSRTDDYRFNNGTRRFYSWQNMYKWQNSILQYYYYARSMNRSYYLSGGAWNLWNIDKHWEQLRLTVWYSYLSGGTYTKTAQDGPHEISQHYGLDLRTGSLPAIGSYKREVRSWHRYYEGSYYNYATLYYYYGG